MKNKPCLIEDRHGQNLCGYCVLCKKKVGPTYKERLAAQVDAIPIETKQKLIDCLHSGKTIGEAMQATGIEETVVAGEIIMRSIGTFSYLKREVN